MSTSRSWCRFCNDPLVGVDNLTISLSALGLLDDEVDPKNIIMQVIRRQPNQPNLPAVDRDFNNFTLGAAADDKFAFRANGQGVILSLNEFMMQLDNFGSRVSEFLEEGWARRRRRLVHLVVPGLCEWS